MIRFRSLSALQDTSNILLAGSSIDDRVPLRVYDPLVTTIHEEQTTFIMTPESSVKWSHQGGSEPWPNSETTVTLNGKATQFDRQVVIC